MKWEVSIPAVLDGPAASVSIVEAENWLGALGLALSAGGQPAPPASAFHCAILEDGSIRVTDFTRRCVYELRTPGGTAPRASSEPRQAPGRRHMAVEEKSFAPAKQKSIPIPADVVPHRPNSRPKLDAQSRSEAAPPAQSPGPALVAHEIFGRRDENPDAGNPLTYRDRLFSVPVGTSAPQAVALLRHYFDEIQLEVAGNPPGKFINLAAFDHAFRGRPGRPAIAALSWKDWRGADPEITYPAAAPAQAPTPSRGVPAVTPVPIEKRRRTSSHELAAADASGTDERLADVFDAMQDLFLAQTQREAAGFALDLAMQKIECEAGSAVLSDIDRGDLFFAAVRGPASERLLGLRLGTGVGIVGAAAKAGEPIAVADVSSDSRFNSDFDRMTGFCTKSLLCAPVEFDGRMLGAIELLNRRGGQFSQGDINVLSYIAENLGNFVATALPDTDEPPGGPEPPTDPEPTQAPAPKASGRRTSEAKH